MRIYIECLVQLSIPYCQSLKHSKSKHVLSKSLSVQKPNGGPYISIRKRPQTLIAQQSHTLYGESCAPGPCRSPCSAMRAAAARTPTPGSAGSPATPASSRADGSIGASKRSTVPARRIPSPATVPARLRPMACGSCALDARRRSAPGVRGGGTGDAPAACKRCGERCVLLPGDTGSVLGPVRMGTGRGSGGTGLRAASGARPA